MMEAALQVLDSGFIIASGVAIVAGLIHGFAGFGVGLVLVPSLAILFGPVEAVAISGITSVVAMAYLIPGAVRVMNRARIYPILVAALFSVPAGAYVLIVIDPLIMQRAIGALVFCLGLLMMSGFKLSPQNSIGMGLGVGVFGGFVGGSTSMAGPIFTAYILSSGVSAQVIRGGIFVVTTAVSVFTVAALAAGSAIGLDTVIRAVALIPANAVGIWAGARLFGRSTDSGYRRIALSLLLLVGAAAMFA